VIKATDLYRSGAGVEIRSNVMDRTKLLAALIAAFVLATPSAANALFGRDQDRPWCALFYVRSILDCSFYTVGQCQAAVSGVGGLCQPNYYYYGPEPKPRRYSRRPRS
jgi:hypothetical protein